MFWRPPSTSLTVISLTCVLCRLCQRIQTLKRPLLSRLLSTIQVWVFSTQLLLNIAMTYRLGKCRRTYMVVDTIEGSHPNIEVSVCGPYAITKGATWNLTLITSFFLLVCHRFNFSLAMVFDCICMF